MTDKEENLERLSDAGTELEQWLLRSRELDEPHPRVVKGTIARVLGQRRRRLRFLQAGVAGTALALAAGFVLWFSTRADGESRAELASESIEPSPSRVPAAVLDPCATAVVAKGDWPLIDDLEDGNARLWPREGRTGSWFVENDRTGRQEPAPGQPWHPIRIEGGGHALRTHGDAFKDWGAAAGFHLADGACYDASAYDGISFIARGRSRVNVSAQMVDVVPVAVGGTCQSDCFGNHLKTIELGARWQRYVVRWADFQQPGFGKKVDFNPKRLRSILFSVAASDTPFDLWLNEVSFLKR